MKNTKLIVNTKSKSYPIYFGNNILNKTGKLVKKDLPEVKKICIISDKKLPNIFLKKLIKSLKKYKLKIYQISSSERNKNLKTANKIIEDLLKDNFNRSDCIIAISGGVIGDLSALVASLTKRGLKFINIPTTLLAQVDASIGGKTAVNSAQGKNLIGTFYQPDFVLTDVSVLKSLSKREMVAGYGEILKHALILDKKFFLWLTKNGKEIINRKNSSLLINAILKSCKIKSKIIEKDEKEKNLRMILNFGHTFAHSFEKTMNFSKNLNHGEAVLLGMIIASELSYQKKLLSFKELLLIKKHYINLNLPMNIKKIFNKRKVKKIVYSMKKDKKNTSNKTSFILLNKIGMATQPGKFTMNDKKIKKFLYSYYQ